MDLRKYEHLLNTKCIKIKFNVTFHFNFGWCKISFAWSLVNKYSSCCHSVLLQSLKTAFDMHSILYMYQRSRDKPDQIRSERLRNKQQWPLQPAHQTNSAFKRRPAYHASWFNIALNCVPGKIGWSHDLTRQVDSIPEPLEPSLPNTYTLYFCFGCWCCYKKTQQFLALLANKNYYTTRKIQNWTETTLWHVTFACIFFLLYLQ